ncbi:MAG: HlyD family type I secretion periplasmic adaptor subunit [Rhizobiaceae bacterium]
MFGSHTDQDYVNSISSAQAAARGANHWPVILTLVFGIFALVGWAYFFEIEEVTTGSGKVIPSRQLQVVQSLEGGIVSNIAVKEGDQVEAGQGLMQIDDTSFSSKLGELIRQQRSLSAEKARLVAESQQLEVVTFPDELLHNAGQAVAAEKQVFESRRIQLLGELDVLQSRLSQRQSQLQELAAETNKLRSTLLPLSKEVELTSKMFDQGVVPEIELLRLTSRYEELKGDQAIVRASVPRVEASIEEAQRQIQTTRNTYVLTARERLAKLEAELAVIRETMTAAEDRVSRTLLRSPVTGVVNKISVATVGAVVQPGMELIDIVPTDDGLLIEAAIRPQDVAFIKPGEIASVKLTAYDYLIYGAMKGRVVRIGADSQSDGNGEQFFRVIVRTEKNYLGDDSDRLQIIPGMVATVDLQTGKNTVLTYLLKPILRAQAEALRER